MKGPRIIAMASALALVAMFGTASAVLGHNVQSISGTVDCSGNYSITVKGDVYNPVTLNVKLDGAVIYGPTLQGTDTSVRDFGPFTGTGATAGETISASTSDGSSTSGALVLTGGPCATPTPSPTVTPTVTIAPTPSPTATSTVEPTASPTLEPTATATLCVCGAKDPNGSGSTVGDCVPPCNTTTPPPTDTTASGDSGGGYSGPLAVLIIFTVGVILLIEDYRRRRTS